LEKKNEEEKKAFGEAEQGTHGNIYLKPVP
jgi:hypothetical protein